MQRPSSPRRRHLALLLGVLVALGAAVAASSVVFAKSSADQTSARSAIGHGKSLDAWFSVTRTGEPPQADALSMLQANGFAGAAAMPSITSARQTAVGADGAHAIVAADDTKACLFIIGGGGGCWAAGGPASLAAPPVLVTGLGQEGAVRHSNFVALVGDGIHEITVGVESGSDVDVTVTNNVAFATVPGRVTSWSWQDPVSGTRQTRSAP